MVTVRWSKADEDELRRLLIHNPDASTTELAEKHSRGVSRNSVMSKLLQMGLKLTNNSDKGIQKKQQKVKQITPQPIANVRPAVEPNYPNKFKPKVMRIVETPHVDGGIDFDELTSSKCHWPLGGGPPFKFCGDTVHRGKYCSVHASIATDRSADRLQPRPAFSRSPTYVFRKRTG